MDFNLLRRFFKIKLDDIAQFSGCSPSFLSLCENGLRKMPDDVKEKVLGAMQILVANKIKGMGDSLFPRQLTLSTKGPNTNSSKK